MGVWAMRGFDHDFIPGYRIEMPVVCERLRASAFAGGRPIKHRRFSLVFNLRRNLALFTAHNIDGGAMLPEGTIARVDRFRFDPTVPAEKQLSDARGYRNNPWDRGHLVRRRSVHWGGVEEAEAADSETFYWTNIAPQHSSLHRNAWGRIEDWILSLAEQGSRRAAVFTGPVLSDDDPSITNQAGQRPFQVPAGFWKIVALVHDGALRIAAFLVWQRDFDRPEPVLFDPVLEQVRLTTIEFLTGLSFAGLQGADPLRPSEGPMAFGDDAPQDRPLTITGPGDIIL